MFAENLINFHTYIRAPFTNQPGYKVLPKLLSSYLLALLTNSIIIILVWQP